MMEFGKRLSWRLSGGVVAIALGALAAAQAQRQGMVDAEVPGLAALARADSVPMPIGAEPGLSSQIVSSGIAPAAYAGMLPSTDPAAGPSVAQAGGPSDDFNDASQPAFIAQVSHEEPIQYDAPVGDEGMSSDGPMSLPQPDAMNPMAINAMAMMSPPEDAYEPEAGEPGPGEMGPGEMGSVNASAMAMPAMSLPGMSLPGMDSPEPQGAFQPGPSMQGMPMDAPESYEPELPPEPAPMPELQFEQAPMMNAGPSMYAEPGAPEQPMPMNSQPASLAAMQGFVGDFGAPPAETFGQNSLRQSNGVENQLRTARQAPSAYEQPLPSLPEPQFNTAAQPAYEPAPQRRETPAQFAGLQRNSPPISINSPGDRRLEGVQTPSVVIHKRAPAEVKVGKPATFVIQVRNVGSAEALGVLVHDRVPAGMQLVDATPAPQMQGELLVWQLGAMPAGAEHSITMQLIPREEGELGSVARVTFEAAASVRTRSTRPELKITQRAPQKVLIGQQLEIELEVANVGTGEATGVILQADVPPGLEHPRGRQLDKALGALRPGEVRREVLRMRAAEPGMIENVVHLISEDAEQVNHSVSVEVIAPQINVTLTGPNRRFLEREAKYMVSIENRGTAPATNVEIVARLDRGFTFNGTENDGHYDPNRHAVLWSIVDLPAGQSASVPVKLLPIEVGDQVIRLEASADLGARSETEATVSVESQAELTFSIADTADPIELGSETTYEIKVRNAGSRNDTNVQVRMLLPPGIEMLESDSDAGTDGRGGVMFAPAKNLPAGGELTYRVRVRGVQPDTHIIQAVVTSDQARVPVTKEESTMVYADQ